MKQYFIALIIGLAVMFSGCEKGFLDAKPNKALLVPETLSDLQALLDNSLNLMNQAPCMNLIADGDFTTTPDILQGAWSAAERNSYTWAGDMYEGENAFDWNILYQQVFYANVVLEGLDKIDVTPANSEEWNRVKGSALFYRAVAFFFLSQEFAVPYVEETAGVEPGIPIRTSADVNIKSERGTLQHTYDQILADLKEAEGLVSLIVSVKTRPSRAAVSSMMARVYLVMGKYDEAGKSAADCLNSNSSLIDYNTLDTTQSLSFPYFMQYGNVELIYYTEAIGTWFFLSGGSPVSEDLFSSYDASDLRKSVYFTASRVYKGSYLGTYYQFSGTAIDEMFLIRAECFARTGDVASALADLNMLLENRYKKGSFTAITGSDAGEILNRVIEERRKELVARGLRWSDLRRLNSDARFAKTITREVNGVSYVLSPGDNKYTFPLPEAEVKISGLQQNPR